MLTAFRHWLFDHDNEKYKFAAIAKLLDDLSEESQSICREIKAKPNGSGHNGHAKNGASE